MSSHTRWVGVEPHRRRSQIAVIDKHGELALPRRIVNHPERFRELLGDPDVTRVALDATYGWECLAAPLPRGGAWPLRPLRLGALSELVDSHGFCSDRPAAVVARFLPRHRVRAIGSTRT